MSKTAVILINLGTPGSPEKKSVRKFLTEFLNDPRVIDLPFLARKILVNLIIVPFRAGKSTKMYQKIWTDKGSPIIFHSRNLLEKLNQFPTGNCKFFLAMRYGNPSINEVLNIIRSEKYTQIIIFPLFPQYASSTSLSAIEKCREIISKWPEMNDVRYIDYFYSNHEFLETWLNRVKLNQYQNFDHILFVFHGLPLRQVEVFHANEKCDKYGCKTQITEENMLCYQAQSYHHARLLASRLGLNINQYTVCFQSRFGKNWLNPFADKVILEKAKQGVKKILLVPLSFVADCLETKLEIEIEYARLFEENGGEKLTMSESLNSGDDWAESIRKIANSTE